jgi:hypothetical protein
MQKYVTITILDIIHLSGAATEVRGQFGTAEEE